MILRPKVGTGPNYFSGEKASADYVPAIFGLDVEAHGGECCGMSHVYNFPPIPDATHVEKVRWIRAAVYRHIDKIINEGEDDSSKFRHCFEVVLNEQQLSGWCEALEEVGFKQVYSFLNSNSGNECHVFLFESNRP